MGQCPHHPRPQLVSSSTFVCLDLLHPGDVEQKTAVGGVVGVVGSPEGGCLSSSEQQGPQWLG